MYTNYRTTYIHTPPLKAAVPLDVYYKNEAKKGTFTRELKWGYSACRGGCKRSVWWLSVLLSQKKLQIYVILIFVLMNTLHID